VRATQPSVTVFYQKVCTDPAGPHRSVMPTLEPARSVSPYRGQCHPIQSSLLHLSSARMNPPHSPSGRRTTIVQCNPLPSLHQPIFAWICLVRPPSRGPHDYNGAAINFGNMRPNRSSPQGPFPGCLRVIKGVIQSDHSGRSRHRVKFCIGLFQLMFPVDERAQSGKEVPKVNCGLAIEDWM
jgi:hypothetical protein